jgi:hypothetical protein
MSAPPSRLHHYVPRWYQKRFLPAGQETLWYLDLKPEMVIEGDIFYRRRALWYWEPARCFCADDLYSMRFGNETTDELEKRLFGLVDNKGAVAADFFTTYDDFRNGTHEAYGDLLRYIGAQRFRTPHGLDWIKKMIQLRDHTQTLLAMQRLFQAFGTMWMEGVWEIVRARNSSIKFIVSDDPVTFFNRGIIPGGTSYPGGHDFPKVGTRTIFPLSMESCLIITHLQLARNPWNNPTEDRENARTFQYTIAKLTDIQFGRELEENEVLRINHILKRSATKFIAAADKEWLYPEKHVGDIHWTKLDRDWFLLPNLWKVRFTTGIFVGNNDGSSWGMDEYGRNPGHPAYGDEERRRWEFRRFEESKREWAKRRFEKSRAQVINQMRENTVSDAMTDRVLRETGLLPPETAASNE